MKKLLITAIAATCLAGCVSKGDYSQARSEADSLQTQLEIAQSTVALYEQVTTIIDSVGKSQMALKIDLETGATYDDYVAKMRGIKDQLETANDKLAKLEEDAGKNAKYIRNLKKQLADKNAEIAELNAAIEGYQESLKLANEENTALISMVDLQGAELDDKNFQIEQKKQELAYLDAKIAQMTQQSVITEADAYYARAEATEMAANRTQLAPKKKKQTLEEALAFYEKSLSLGKAEAKAKVDALKAKLK